MRMPVIAPPGLSSRDRDGLRLRLGVRRLAGCFLGIADPFQERGIIGMRLKLPALRNQAGPAGMQQLRFGLCFDLRLSRFRH
jgi:hypothetical protein